MPSQDLVWISAAALLGYLLGSVNFAVLVAKRHGVDILKAGSGNPGATNVKRVIGKKAGNLVFALDALKGFVSAGWPFVFGVMLVSRFGLGESTPTLMQLAGFFGALIGHCFSCFLGFKGGKGVATAAGVLLALDPSLGLITLGIWLAIAFILRYSSLAAIVAAAAAPVTAFLFWGSGTPLLVVGIIAIALVVKHWGNLQRLMAGTEPKIGAKKKA